jgi:hypothetical protein
LSKGVGTKLKKYERQIRDYVRSLDEGEQRRLQAYVWLMVAKEGKKTQVQAKGAAA